MTALEDDQTGCEKALQNEQENAILKTQQGHLPQSNSYHGNGSMMEEMVEGGKTRRKLKMSPLRNNTERNAKRKASVKKMLNEMNRDYIIFK